MTGPGSEGAPQRPDRCSGNVCRVECKPNLEAECWAGWPVWRRVGLLRKEQTGQVSEVRVRFRVKWRGPGSEKGAGESGEFHTPQSGLGAPDRIPAHPRRPAPTCSWGGGSRWGPLIANQARGWSQPGSGEMAITQALLSGKSPHSTAPSWEWEQKGPGRHRGRGCWCLERCSDASKTGARWVSLWGTGRWTVLRLDQSWVVLVLAF